MLARAYLLGRPKAIHICIMLMCYFKLHICSKFGCSIFSAPSNIQNPKQHNPISTDAPAHDFHMRARRNTSNMNARFRSASFIPSLLIEISSRLLYTYTTSSIYNMLGFGCCVYYQIDHCIASCVRKQNLYDPLVKHILTERNALQSTCMCGTVVSVRATLSFKSLARFGHLQWPIDRATHTHLHTVCMFSDFQHKFRPYKPNLPTWYALHRAASNRYFIIL